MSYLEELLPEFRNGAKIRCSDWKNPRGYIQSVKGTIANEYNLIYTLPNHAILSDKWELYTEPAPDWDYIIENKCLCWFWDDADEKFNNIGFLKAENSDRFLSSDSFEYAHCRPVRKDEVSFYEGKKDE
uniref:Uncharacterized protein n=1 Tax=Dulem virus 29 TaxID=3145747 RepID=A0AAU8B3L6_9CAUD